MFVQLLRLMYPLWILFASTSDSEEIIRFMISDLDISRLKIPTGRRPLIAAWQATIRQKDVFPSPGLAATTTRFWLWNPPVILLRSAKPVSIPYPGCSEASFPA